MPNDPVMLQSETYLRAVERLALYQDWAVSTPSRHDHALLAEQIDKQKRIIEAEELKLGLAE